MLCILHLLIEHKSHYIGPLPSTYKHYMLSQEIISSLLLVILVISCDYELLAETTMKNKHYYTLVKKS